MEARKEEEFEMTDDRRMRTSGAAASGYHAPTEQDIQDLKKDHHTSTTPNAVNADEFIRAGSSTGALQGAEDEENLHPRQGLRVEEGRELGTAASESDGPVAKFEYPQDTTPESQTTTTPTQGAKRAAQGSGVDGDLDEFGPSDTSGEGPNYRASEGDDREDSERQSA